MPLSILCIHHSPRLTYSLELIFRHILAIPYQLVSSAPSHSGPMICYGSHDEPGSLHIPDAGLLWEKGTHWPTPLVRGTHYPIIFSSSEAAYESAESHTFPFDIFSSVFWLCSEYAHYQHPDTDQHGRYLEGELLTALMPEDGPLVHRWVHELKCWLFQAFPQLAQEQAKQVRAHRITFDLDQPWKYRHKGLHIQLAGLLRDIASAKWARAGERIQTFRSGHDPFDTFDRIQELCPISHTTFFILLERRHLHDSRFTWRHPLWREKIASLHRAGYQIGIHPSYSTSDHQGLIEEESHRLKDITGEMPTTARMHFLRYQLPDTRRQLLEAGIREDYTPCRFATGGFPNGMAIPYPWYDLLLERQTDLMLVPSTLMDRTLVSYLSQTPESARELLGTYLKWVKWANGSFVVCLHNDCLSESEEWKGWSALFTDFIQQLITSPSNEPL